MKIWFAAAIPCSSQGGVNRVMCEQARGLAARGHTTACVYPEARWERTYLGFAAGLAWRMLRAGSRRPDWIIARSCDGVFCALVCAALRLRTRVVLHNLSERSHELLLGTHEKFRLEWRPQG